MISIGAISLGIVSLGYCSFGIVAIGIYALGVLAVGGQIGVGVLVFGKDAIGVLANGSTHTFQDTTSNGRECVVAISSPVPYEVWLEQTNMPQFIRLILGWLHTCG